jgi:endo-1,4-beta-xylanase
LSVSRRSFLWGAAVVGAAGLAGCSEEEATRSSAPELPDCPAFDEADARTPLWETAFATGVVYGSSTATWQISDTSYRRLFGREAAILFTEDDLLWYRLRPTPESDLDFTYGDRIIAFAERQGQLAFGAHLVWDEGFGDGWTDDDLWGLDQGAARDLLFGTVDAVVAHYRGRVAGWIVANEVLDGNGLRTDVPWHSTIGPSYVAEAFRRARAADPDATLVLNEFGYETDDGFARADDKRAATLQLLDDLLADDISVDALGVQAHLDAARFLDSFDPDGYREFLAAVADRGLAILITELDVLDDGLPAAFAPRDRAIAEAIREYTAVALDEPAVKAVMTFGLSDRYTWLEEDFPRADGSPRRPLPFDRRLRPKPAYEALADGLGAAAPRASLWVPPRC